MTVIYDCDDYDKDDDLAILYSFQITNSLPRSWLIFLSETTLPTQETFARFLVNLASCLQRSCAGCSDSEKKKARYVSCIRLKILYNSCTFGRYLTCFLPRHFSRSGSKKIVQYLLSIKSKDKANTVALEYGLGEVTANV
jgi:hypothetical protein